MGDDISFDKFQGINFGKVLTSISENRKLAETLQGGDPNAIGTLIEGGELNELFVALGLDPSKPEDKEKLKKILETFMKAGPGLNGMITNLATSLMGPMMAGSNDSLKELAELSGADKDPEKFLGMLKELAPNNETTKMLTGLDNIRKQYNKDGNGLTAMASVVNTVGISKGYAIYERITLGEDPIRAVSQVIGLDDLAKEANKAAVQKLPEARADAAKKLEPQNKAGMATASKDSEKPGARPADSANRTVTVPAGQEQKTAFDPIKTFMSKATNAKGEYKPNYKYEKSGSPEVHTFTFPNKDEALEFMYKARSAGLEVKGNDELEQLYEKKHGKPQAAPQSLTSERGVTRSAPQADQKNVDEWRKIITPMHEAQAAFDAAESKRQTALDKFVHSSEKDKTLAKKEYKNAKEEAMAARKTFDEAKKPFKEAFNKEHKRRQDVLTAAMKDVEKCNKKFASIGNKDPLSPKELEIKGKYLDAQAKLAAARKSADSLETDIRAAQVVARKDKPNPKPTSAVSTFPTKAPKYDDRNVAVFRKTIEPMYKAQNAYEIAKRKRETADKGYMNSLPDKKAQAMKAYEAAEKSERAALDAFNKSKEPFAKEQKIQRHHRQHGLDSAEQHLQKVKKDYDAIKDPQNLSSKDLDVFRDYQRAQDAVKNAQQYLAALDTDIRVAQKESKEQVAKENEAFFAEFQDITEDVVSEAEEEYARILDIGARRGADEFEVNLNEANYAEAKVNFDAAEKKLHDAKAEADKLRGEIKDLEDKQANEKMDSMETGVKINRLKDELDKAQKTAYEAITEKRLAQEALKVAEQVLDDEQFDQISDDEVLETADLTQVVKTDNQALSDENMARPDLESSSEHRTRVAENIDKLDELNDELKENTEDKRSLLNKIVELQDKINEKHNRSVKGIEDGYLQNMEALQKGSLKNFKENSDVVNQRRNEKTELQELNNELASCKEELAVTQKLEEAILSNILSVKNEMKKDLGKIKEIDDEVRSIIPQGAHDENNNDNIEVPTSSKVNGNSQNTDEETASLSSNSPAPSPSPSPSLVKDDDEKENEILVEPPPGQNNNPLAQNPSAVTQAPQLFSGNQDVASLTLDPSSSMGDDHTAGQNPNDDSQSSSLNRPPDTSKLEGVLDKILEICKASLASLEKKKIKIDELGISPNKINEVNQTGPGGPKYGSLKH